MKERFSVPTILVVFGITGDLFKTKILEGLLNLYNKNQLPEKTKVYGFGRRDWSNEDLHDYLRNTAKDQGLDLEEGFVNLFEFIKGDFEDPKSFESLSERVGRVDDEWKYCSNKLFYLSTPPNFYKTITSQLDNSGLTEPCSDEEGWTRVILEKPFGVSLKDAINLDKHLSNLFKEEQIYRVDHYLAKESVRNILAFRFSNALLEPAWDNKSVEKIEVKMLEKDPVGKRESFYETVGALRDVGQNHVLQMLALFTMDRPKDFTCSPIRKNRAEVIKYLSIKNIKENTLRAQYNAYTKGENVKDTSQTETYFKIQAFFEGGKFKDVPVMLEAGKALKENRTEINIYLKHLEPCLCPPDKHKGNAVTYSIKPKEEISIKFFVKKPGYKFEVKEEEFDFDYKKRNSEGEYIQDYEQLLLDIIKGDQTLFVSTEEVMNQWKFVEPVLKDWDENEVKLSSYNKGESPWE